MVYETMAKAEKIIDHSTLVQAAKTRSYMYYDGAI